MFPYKMIKEQAERRAELEAQKKQASGSNDLLATDNSTIGAFDGYAGDSEEWGHEFVRVIVKVKKSEALKMKDCTLIYMKW